MPKLNENENNSLKNEIFMPIFEFNSKYIQIHQKYLFIHEIEL